MATRKLSTTDPISVTIDIDPNDLMLLGRLTGTQDAREAVERVVKLTVAMCEECNDG